MKDSQPATGSSPIFSIAGVMPGTSEMDWKTAYPNPDRESGQVRFANHGPSFSIAGVTPGRSDSGWQTAMPDPTRDTLDASGYVITKVEAQIRAELARRPGVLTLRAGRTDATEKKAA